ncbi:hypothetical protein ScalyP_jg9631, partial [Parmales sp. scaly parma]
MTMATCCQSIFPATINWPDWALSLLLKMIFALLAAQLLAFFSAGKRRRQRRQLQRRQLQRRQLQRRQADPENDEDFVIVDPITTKKGEVVTPRRSRRLGVKVST